MSEVNLASVSVGNLGNAIHQNQTMAAQEGFKTVSKTWYNKTIDFDAAISKLANNKGARIDHKTDLKSVSVSTTHNNCGLDLNINGVQYTPTEHALKQMCLWLDVPQTMVNHYMQPKVVGNKVRYNRNNDDLSLLKTAFNLGISRVDSNKKFLFRTYTDKTLRAMLTLDYRAIDNTWYLELLKELMPDGRVSHFNFSDADTLYFNVLIPDSMVDVDGDMLGFMISSGNCEIGTRRLSQYPSVFRAICMNGCIWDQVKGANISQVHRGKISLNDLRDRITKNIENQIPLAEEAVKRFTETKKKNLDVTAPTIIAQLSIDNRLSPKQATQILSEYNTHEKEHKNLYGIVNAITRAGQAFDRETWLDFDNMAGRLIGLSDATWVSLQARSKLLDKEEYKTVYGLV
jgi:hypothetical protein